MSQVKIISIDMVSAPESSTDLSVASSGTGESNTFSQLVDQQLQQDKATSKQTTEKTTNENGLSATNSDKPEDLAQASKKLSDDVDKSTNNAEKNDKNTALDKDTETENAALDAQQHVKDKKVDKHVNEAQEDIDTQLVNEIADQQSKEFIEILTKSELLLKSDVKQSGERVAINSIKTADEIKAEKTKPDLVAQLPVEPISEEIDTEHAGSDNISARLQNHAASNEVNKVSSPKIEQATLAESNLDEAETKSDDLSKNLLKSQQQVGEHSLAKNILKEKVDNSNTGQISQSTATKAEHNDSEQRLAQQANEDLALSEVNFTDDKAENSTVNVQQNQSLSSKETTATVTAVQSKVTQIDQVNAEQINTRQANIGKETELGFTDTIERSAGPNPQVVNQNTRFEASKIHQAVVQANAGQTSAGQYGEQADSEANGENENQHNQDNWVEQQLVQNKDASVVNAAGITRSSFAETIAATMGASTRVEDQSMDQKAIQQQLDNIASRVVESNQVAAKAQQVQLETISIYRRDFANAVKDKVMVMVSQKLQQVDIQLDPPELGNVHVRLNLQNDQAMVSFTVQNQQAKDAFEQQMGRLREMLEESGVDVGDANVAQQGKQSEGEQESGFGRGGSLTQSDDSEVVMEMSQLVKPSATGIDFYA